MRALKEKIQVAYKEKHIRIRADFSMETLKTRRIWSSAFQILKDYKGQLRLIYLDKQSAIIDEKGKTLLHIKSLKTFVSNKWNLKKIQEWAKQKDCE